MRISDWSSDVCSSDLWNGRILAVLASVPAYASFIETDLRPRAARRARRRLLDRDGCADRAAARSAAGHQPAQRALAVRRRGPRSEERRGGKEWVRRVDLGGRRRIKKKKTTKNS